MSTHREAADRPDSEIVFRWTQVIPIDDHSLEERVVAVRRRTLEKIARKHVSDVRQPWDRIIAAPLLAKLRDPGSSSPSQREAALLELAGIIRDVAVDSAARPLVFRCQSQPKNRGRSARWTILHVGKCGAYVAVDTGVAPARGQHRPHLLLTCFFGTPHPADIPPGNAWRTMAQRLVRRWSRFDPRFGAFRVYPDDEVRTVAQSLGPPMLRWHPRFISEERWGIRELADGTTGFRSLAPGKW